MCISYAGNSYDYGFRFTINENSISKKVSILLSSHRSDDQPDSPYVYRGICLDNGLIVVSDKNERHTALYDIVRTITDGIICAEKMRIELYPNREFSPLINLLDKNSEKCYKVYKRFTKRMANAKTLAEYKEIRKKISPILENPIYGLEEFNISSLKSFFGLQIKRIFALFAFLNIKILSHCVPIMYDCKDMALAAKRFQKDPCFNINDFEYRRV